MCLQIWEKGFLLHKKGYFFFQNSVFGEIQFSQKSLTNSKKQPLTLSRQVLVQQTPIIACCYYKPPRSGPHEVRNCREAAVPEKEPKILEKGARGDRSSPEQNESPRPKLFKRTIVRFPGTRSCGDIIFF